MPTPTDLTEPTRSELRTATRRARRLVRGERRVEVLAQHAYLAVAPAAACFTPRLGLWWGLLAGFVAAAAADMGSRAWRSWLAASRRRRVLALEGRDRVLLHVALATTFSGGRDRWAASSWLERLTDTWSPPDLAAVCVSDGTAPEQLCPRFAHRALAVALDPLVGALWAHQRRFQSAEDAADAAADVAHILYEDGVDDIAYALVAGGECTLSLIGVIAASRALASG